jgi:hypothetical protein
LKERPPATEPVCDRAEQCCNDAGALLGMGKCDVAFQLQNKISARTCLLAISGFRTLLEAKQLAPPASCPE